MINRLITTMYVNAILSPKRTGVTRRVNHKIGDGADARLPGADGWIMTRSWGTGPTILLLHGWNGNGADMEDFVEPLVARGYRVVAFDAPAHGESSGRRTNLLQCAGAALQVAAAHGPVHGAISHSFGGPTIALAMRSGLSLNRLVMIGPPRSIAEMSAVRARKAGVPEQIIDRGNRLIAERFAIDWDHIATDRMIAEADVPVLVIHDRDDRTVPWDDGAKIASAAANGRLVTTSGLGHDAILWDPGVVQEAADFLAQ